MSKIFGFYSKKSETNVEKMWYQSSNVKYSECIDNENDLKTLKVVFNNGSQYQYNRVKVQDYLLLREDESQGKALNKYIKANGYDYEKLENADIQSLNEELDFRQNGGIFVDYKDGKLTMKNSIDEEIFNKGVELNIDAFNTVCGVLTAVGKNIHVTNDINNG